MGNIGIFDHDMVAVGTYLAEKVDPPATHFESKYGDGIGMEFPSASFDGVMANCVISHVRDLEGFLAEANRLLRPGGIFFLSDENNSLYLPARPARRGWRMGRSPTVLTSWRAGDDRRAFQDSPPQLLEAVRGPAALRGTTSRRACAAPRDRQGQRKRVRIP